jgi:F-box protein 18 (helicase)
VRAFCAGEDDASALDALGDDALGDDSLDGGVSSRSARLSARLQRALCSYAYPADPLDPELVRSMRRTEAGAAWLERRWDDWRDALVSAYASLRLGRCDAFYVVYDQRVVLFCAPGVAESTDGFAVVTDAAEGKFADAMAGAAVGGGRGGGGAARALRARRRRRGSSAEGTRGERKRKRVSPRPPGRRWSGRDTRKGTRL